jgi:integrase
LRQLFELYRADLEARGKGPDTIGRVVTTEKAVERILPGLPATPVSRITSRDVYDFRQAMAREGKVVYVTIDGARQERRVPALPSTINRDLRTLRAMLKAARPDFRFPGGAFFPEDETRVRWLRPEEELLVLEPMPSPFREMAKLAALTLMRLSEIRLLRREQVHLEQGVVLLPRAKAGARPVVLGHDARKLLQAALEANPKSEWAFPNPDGAPYSRVHVSRVFRKASRDAGLRDFHFHDGAQRRLHGADRHGPRRVEDGADDAAVCSGNRPDAEGGCRGSGRIRKSWFSGAGLLDVSIFQNPRACLVRTDRSLISGVLYIVNDRVVVLLNHSRMGIDFRPRWVRRATTVAPETDATVIPRSAVRQIQILRSVGLRRRRRSAGPRGGGGRTK